MFIQLRVPDAQFYCEIIIVFLASFYSKRDDIFLNVHEKRRDKKIKK
jgi:hypothetical protein